MVAVKRKFDAVASNGEPTGYSHTKYEMDREKEKEEREKLVLWRKPLKTLVYFCKELSIGVTNCGKHLLRNRAKVGVCLLAIALIVIFFNIGGSHQKYLQRVRGKVMWCLYWIGLGILSSVGLGTGLHTFLLYLGPHIAAVTLAAYECGGLNFPEPPYPDELICPEHVDPSWKVTMWNIMSKVRLEAMMWGAGTAMGELPPYFMARAARLSGYDPDDEEDLRQFEELQRKQLNPSSMTTLDRAKLTVEKLVEKVGFFGILACASIPNPLFDLAGITCGHFLVPFWTFFGATLIGKAVVKMHIQKMFVIVAFNESLVERAVTFMGCIPGIGNRLQEPFKEFLRKQKMRLHRKTGEAPPKESGSILAYIFEKFVILMIIYFLISIINSLAQSHHKRLCKEARGVSGHSKKATD